MDHEALNKLISLCIKRVLPYNSNSLFDKSGIFFYFVGKYPGTKKYFVSIESLIYLIPLGHRTTNGLQNKTARTLIHACWAI